MSIHFYSFKQLNPSSAISEVLSMPCQARASSVHSVYSPFCALPDDTLAGVSKVLEVNVYVDCWGASSFITSLMSAVVSTHS